nr:hypothetical protein [Tanacetum cinerariifolium]
MDKRKRFKLTLEIFIDIFKICPSIQGQDFDALPTDEEIVSFLRKLGHTVEMNSLNDVVVDHMHQPWRTFAAIINKSLSGKTTDYVELLWDDFIYQIDNRAFKKQEKIYYPRFTKVIIHYFLTQDKTISWRNKIRIHTSKDDYLINTLRFVSAKEETQIYGAKLPESFTSSKMKETQAYKTYLSFATRATPPRKTRKFKKSASLKLTIVSVSTEEPMGKSKRVKRPTNKSTKAPTRGVVTRETHEMPLTKKKEKVDITRGKGIKLLSQVALTEDAQFKEVCRKSMGDFYKNHPSGSGTITKTTPSIVKIKPSVTNKGTGDSNKEQDSSGEDNDQENDSNDDKTQPDNENESDSKHETDESDSGLKSDHEENKEDKDDEEEVKDEFVKTLSNDSDDEDESKITDKAEGDEEEEIDYTTSQLYDDMDIRLNEPKTEVLVTISSHSSDLAAKFLNFSDIPHTDAKIVSPIDVYVHHEVSSQQIPTLLIVYVSVISNSSPVFSTVIPQSLPSFTPPSQQSTSTPPPTTKATNLQFSLPNFTSMVKESLKDAILAKESSQPQYSYEVAATLTEFELKKILIKKIDKSESYLVALEHRECYEGLKKSYDLDKAIFSTYDKVYSLKRNQKDKEEDPYAGSYRGLKKRKTSKDVDAAKGPKAKESQSGLSKGDKSQLKSSGKSVQPEEPEFEVADSDMPQDQKANPVTRVEIMRKHGYGYLREIKVQRADNNLYTFKEGDFLRLRINDIKLRNSFKNVHQKHSYSEASQRSSTSSQKIPEEDQRRNRLMRSDELYKFSDGTLTRLRTSLEDITKNIHMEYLPKRRLRTLEKKRANIMIKVINKQVKERRMTRSLEKFVGGRDYGTDLRLLQRTI